jgi:hypothetical protein
MSTLSIQITYRKGKRFREWAGFGIVTDSKPSDDIVDMLGFLTFEMVQVITEVSLKIKEQEYLLAARLMGRTARLWHDQALYKEPSGGFTPWHVDQQYWPMASPHSITAWIPLQPVPIEMGPLCFGRGSHRKRIA